MLPTLTTEAETRDEELAEAYDELCKVREERDRLQADLSRITAALGLEPGASVEEMEHTSQCMREEGAVVALSHILRLRKAYRAAVEMLPIAYRQGKKSQESYKIQEVLAAKVAAKRHSNDKAALARIASEAVELYETAIHIAEECDTYALKSQTRAEAAEARAVVWKNQALSYKSELKRCSCLPPWKGFIK